MSGTVSKAVLQIFYAVLAQAQSHNMKLKYLTSNVALLVTVWPYMKRSIWLSYTAFQLGRAGPAITTNAQLSYVRGVLASSVTVTSLTHSVVVMFDMLSSYKI